MKNTILSLSFVLLAMAAIAQDGYYHAPQRLKFSAGAEAGLNLSGTTTSPYNRWGGKAGILVNAAICKRLDIRSGLYYSMKGGSFEKDQSWSGEWFVPGGDMAVKLRINYLELPLNLLLRIGHRRNFYFGPGAYIAYATGGKLVSRGYNEIESSRNIFEVYDGPYPGSRPLVYKRLDYGVQASVGYRLPLGLFVQARINQGLANIVNSNTNYKTTNYGFTFSAGWMLHDR